MYCLPLPGTKRVDFGGKYVDIGAASCVGRLIAGGVMLAFGVETAILVVDSWHQLPRLILGCHWPVGIS